MRRLISVPLLTAMLAAPIAPALAMPSEQTVTTPPPVTLVAGGCGIGFHRGPYGGCRPNRVGPVYVHPGWGWRHPHPYWRHPGWRRWH